MGKGGGGGSTPSLVDDNLKNKQFLNIIDLVSEGPIEGPEVTGDTDSPDYIFNEYRGKVKEPDPDLLSVGLRYNPPGIGTIDDPVDLVLTRKKP